MASFMVCAMPGFSPMTNTLPKTASTSFTKSISAFGPETITASVPFLGAADASAHRAIDLHDVLLCQHCCDLCRDG